MSDDYRRQTPASAAAFERARERVPGGVTSNVKYFPPYPIYMSRAAGSRIVDADGREYIDYCLAFGPLVLGHGHPAVMEAVHGELDRMKTTILGAPSELEFRLADRLSGLLPSAEMVRFTSSGTEATLHAIRLARGVTGRRRLVKFEGHYHGVHDAVLMNLDRPLPPAAACDGIPPDTREATIVLPFNDVPALRADLAAAADVAAVIVEPVARGVVQPDPAFLQELRTITARRGIVLIFDEVVVWPRLGLGGAQGLYGVTPDLTTLGKALGGGLPLGAVAGRRALMEAFAPRAARDGGPGPYVFHGGTYNGTPVALAAGLAVLDVLSAPGPMDTLMRLGELLRGALRDVFDGLGVPARVIGSGAIADFYFTRDAVRSCRDIWSSDLERRRALDYQLFGLGVYNAPVHRWHVSLAHTEADIEQSADAVRQAAAAFA